MWIFGKWRFIVNPPLAAIDSAELQVGARLDTKPHPRAADFADPLHTARADVAVATCGTKRSAINKKSEQ